ncbi:MAG TPA: 5-methyltetrahydropteroyltriglutamate--homocysteine methyltransferase [Methanothrix sp.]|nr:5-methyltetrahydropteroyltriglutamate--homocysteine methyltransferase [Methanothrix sp.]HQE87049.1 5-methyltetrahydropteroyltriglutamate--homocysteine methyltransferase [Methanothrix sp.]HQI67433.1 5-methyltetrahydropteroyltriglutamate--homocysteine methyltransferase [Methanothrix sp.]HRS85392.1 5-methyltetrahydropteroyltriglutamate--homocysteine methyltransferase [Methanothrix sp.]HRT16422.1 5-methyltetrahydropteroyltriglutamate--homocysteine methyltransferase [Methanothrix sp.]
MMAEKNAGLFFDDVGSFPLPRGVHLKGLSAQQYLDLVRDVLEQKKRAGVEAPTYPQLRDMIRMFMDGIADPTQSESPYIIKREFARILELSAVPAGQKVRVCVTGPLELYISAFGTTAYSDILYALAESVARFLERARQEEKMSVASLDEPSLGISSAIIFSEDEIKRALDIASAPCRGMDCEVHLHSPLFAGTCAAVPGISIVGIESAAHPDYLQLIDRRMLEDTGSYLRAGIARTDILSISARLNERLGVNLWDDPARLEREILETETAQVMMDRLERAYDLFGERLAATGPDCGLGSWPSQELAANILSNCAEAVRGFRKARSLHSVW